MMRAAEYRALMERRARGLTGVVSRRVERAALAIRDMADARVRLVTRDGRLSGARNRRVGVRYRMGADRMSAVVGMTGPAHLIERPTSPHVITSRASGGSRRSRAARLGAVAWSRRTGLATLPVGPLTARGAGLRPVLIPGVGPRQYARHPGTRGRWPWRDSLRVSVPRARMILRVPVVRELDRGDV